MAKKVAVIMGSDSDFATMKASVTTLKTFGVPFEVHVISAHRTPYEAESFAKSAKDNDFGVIIAAAGKAAHLAGVIAAYTTLPVIGVPIKTSMMGGLDSLLSMVQMPKGIPVACVAVDGSDNAALLAIQMLSIEDEDLALKMQDYKVKMANDVNAKDKKIQDEVNSL